MNGSALELVGGPLRAVRRAVIWWSMALAALVALTAAFWPIFKGSTGISDALNHLPPGVLTAFGLQDFGSPTGYLRANLYEIFIPILLVAAAVTFVGGQTASEEAAGRLEIYIAQPVSRRAIYLGRAIAALIGLAVVTSVVTVVQLVSDAVVDLPIDLGHLIATMVLSMFLAGLYGSFAFAIACVRPWPSIVNGAGIGLALVSYLVVALFSFTTVLAPFSQLSPWNWAFGGNPLEQATDPWRYIALVAPAIVLDLVGLRLIAARDIAAG